MKKNIFKTFFGSILKGFKLVLLNILFVIAYILMNPFIRCKIKGKNNLNKKDEARVFISNHYEIYGPFITFFRFPYKYRPWVIDRMLDEKTIKEQMSISIYNNFPKYPRWLKAIVINLVKDLLLLIMRISRSIPVSRDNPRKNVETMQISTKTLEKGTPIFIWPEKDYVKEGIGEFMSGFEHIGKYYYQKTGKKITFYPIFTSQKNKTIYIEKPIVYNPDEDPNIEKDKIVLYLHETMENSYIKNELGAPAKKRKHNKNGKSK